MAVAPVRVRRTYLFSGRVQGVGFRMTVAALCDSLPLTGFVRNLDDGRVECVAEAPAAVIDALIARIQQRFGGHLRDVHCTESAATGEFADFDIRK